VGPTAPATGLPVRPASVDVVVHGRDGSHPGSAFVRVLLRLRWAERAGLVTARVHDAASILRAGPAPDADALLVQRDALLDAATAASVLGRAAREGIPVVLDVDDDLFSPSARRHLAGGGYSEERFAALDATLAAAARVVVSTEVLVGRLPAGRREVHVLPAALDAATWGLAEPDGTARSEGLLYMGSHTHAADLALLDGLDVHDRAAVDVVGVTGPDGARGLRLLDVARRPVPYPDLVAWLRAESPRWGAGLAPLVDDGFTAAKSDLKFLEYSAAGLATVASAVPAYRAAGAHGALLVTGGRDAWGPAVSRLRLDPDERAERARTARAHVRAHRTYREDDGWLTALVGPSGRRREPPSAVTRRPDA